MLMAGYPEELARVHGLEGDMHGFSEYAGIRVDGRGEFDSVCFQVDSLDVLL